MGLQSSLIHLMTELKGNIFTFPSNFIYLLINLGLCPEVHRVSCIQENGSNKYMEFHVSNIGENIGDNVLSRVFWFGSLSIKTLYRYFKH